jgi:hypothetical protein
MITLVELELEIHRKTVFGTGTLLCVKKLLLYIFTLVNCGENDKKHGFSEEQTTFKNLIN